MSERYLVVGATGFLGEHVVRQLVAQKRFYVRTLARSYSQTIEELGVEVVRGDLFDGGALDRALQGCKGVYLLAGMVSRSPEDQGKMMRLHVEGTRRVMEMAVAAGVSRVVVASTSGTVAVSKDKRVHTEKDGFATETVAGWPYYTSKIYQEKLAFDLGKRLGIETVCINPSLLLGPGDRRLSSTGDVLKLLRGEIPYVPKGGISFVDVRDVAMAAISAMEHGKNGERYLLGAGNFTMNDFFARVCRTGNVSKPKMRIPAKISRRIAGAIEEVYRWRNVEPPIDQASAEMAEHYWWLDSSKAERELGFAPRDPGLTIAQTIQDLRRGI